MWYNDRMAYLVSFVGMSGVGKSTAIEAAKTELADYDPAVFHQRKTGTAALAIDEQLKAANGTISKHNALELIAKASVYVMQDYVIPALEQDRPVIMDRGFHCAIAYHGAGYELGEAYVEERLAAAGLTNILPNRIFLLDAPIKVAQERRAARADGLARLHDDAPYDVHLRTRFSYLRQAHDAGRAEYASFHVIDTAEMDANAVASEVGRIVADDMIRLQK